MTSETDQLGLEALRGLRDEFQGVRAQVTNLQATVGSVAQVRDEIDQVRSLLVSVREDVRGVLLATVKNVMAIEHLDERVEMLRESTMTGLGFATQVNLQQKKLAKHLPARALELIRIFQEKLILELKVFFFTREGSPEDGRRYKARPLAEPAKRSDQKSNYELFNCNNINIRYWSWNYRGCWHQTCPPIDPR